jgi:hypothetical protein
MGGRGKDKVKRKNRGQLTDAQKQDRKVKLAKTAHDKSKKQLEKNNLARKAFLQKLHPKNTDSVDNEKEREAADDPMEEEEAEEVAMGIIISRPSRTPNNIAIELPHPRGRLFNREKWDIG